MTDFGTPGEAPPAPIPPALSALSVEPDRLDKSWAAAFDSAPLSSGRFTITDAPTPVFTLSLSAMTRNIEAMHAWTAERGILLAPHGKTTMSPALWRWQLDKGAWAITVANEFQLRVAHRFGIHRVIVANELISPTGLQWLAAELGPDFDVTCWVDSFEGLALMERALEDSGASARLGVCVEVGGEGTRGGVRDADNAILLAEAVGRSQVLELRGLAGFEAVVPGDSMEERVANVRQLLAWMAPIFDRVAPLVEVSNPILTIGGSAYFDLVDEILSPVVAANDGARLVIRSGAYLVHDDGLYRHVTPAALRSGPELEAAGHVWARVISTPEPELSLLDAGRRDVPYDALPPVVLEVFRDGRTVYREGDGLAVVHFDDQHLRVRGEGLRVGDYVRLGISHPCTLFDKWRTALLIDDVDSPRIRGGIATYF